MSLSSVPPLGKSGEAEPRLAFRDLRLDAFARLIEAADRADTRAALGATRELRRLGWSICPVTPARKGGA